MKLIKIISISLLGGFIISATGCTKKINDFGSLNQSPDIVTEPNTGALLTSSISVMGNEVTLGAVFSALYSQYLTETQYTEVSRYTKQQPDFGGYYSGVLYDLVNIIKYNSNPETAGKALGNGSNANQIAIARILKAWWFVRVTDQWGDIPYSKALDFNGIIPYDDQQAIYTDLFKELKEAVAQFDGGASMKGDILFGDASYNSRNDYWKRFANSIRMIMALRLIKIDPTKAKTEFLDAFNNSAGYISSNSQNAELRYPGGNYASPFYLFYIARQDYAVTKTITDFMVPNGDLRINAWGSSNVGFPYGLERTNAVAFAGANPNWARVMNPTIRTATQPIPVLTASQVTLARAEAAQRGWTAENATSLYSLGIQQSWEYWGVYSASPFTNYLSDPDIALTAGTELSKIIQQRWLATFPNGVEGWNIWRSTGLPNLVPAPGTGLQIPRRFAIATTHYNTNTEYTNVVAAKYTVNGEPDSQYGRMWWDKP